MSRLPASTPFILRVFTPTTSLGVFSEFLAPLECRTIFPSHYQKGALGSFNLGFFPLMGDPGQFFSTLSPSCYTPAFPFSFHSRPPIPPKARNSTFYPLFLVSIEPHIFFPFNFPHLRPFSNFTEYPVPFLRLF